MASDLDTTFNAPNGFISTNFTFTPQENFGKALVLQSDGKIIMAGNVKNNSLLFEIGLVRYNSNGSYDSTFGTSGLATAQLSDSSSTPSTVEVKGLALQSDGKIVVCGYLLNSSSFYDLFVARFTTSGVLDTSFGTIGYVIITPNNFSTTFAPTAFDNCYSSDVQIDSTSGTDKIVICGYVRTTPTNELRVSMARYDTSGLLDTSFGTSGLVQTNLGTPLNKYPWSFAISNSGDYFLAGLQETSAINNNFMVAKFNTNGAAVGAFGSSGLVVVSNFYTGSSDGAHSIKIQQDGKIVVGGTAIKQPTGEECYALCRLDPITGLLDSAFGTSGKVTTDLSTQFPPIYLNGYSLAIQNDNKIVLGGYFRYPTTFNNEASFSLARYDTSGSLDTSFGINGNGLILEDIVVGTMQEHGLSLAIQPNGQILLGGVRGEFSDISDTKYFFVARYFGFPPNPPPVPVAPICFPAGTPVSTDQGSIPIEKIEPGKNTIRGKEIVAITKTISPFNKLVCFEKGSLGHNIPNKRTYVSLEHCIVHRRKLIPALRFVNKHGIYYVNYMNNYLYNVLMENHTYMMVNNMMVETLNPKNIVAKLVSTNLSNDEKIKLVCRINDSVRLKMKMINHQKNEQVLQKLNKNYTIRNKQVFNVHARHPHPAYNITVNANSLVKRRYKQFQYTRHAKQIPGAGFSIKSKIHVKSI